MMLELLLIVGALSGGPEAQNKTIDAYGKYSGIQKMIDQYGEKHPDVAFLVGSVGLYKTKHLYYQAFGPFYHDLYAEGNSIAQTFWFKKEF